MKKEFGAFLILGLLVLSLSFSSAGWLSDTYNNIRGNSITGNAILPNSQCDTNKLNFVKSAIVGTDYSSYSNSIVSNNITSLVCNSTTTVLTLGNATTTCPSNVQNSFCVRAVTKTSTQVCIDYGLLGKCRTYATQTNYKTAIYGVNVATTSEPPVEPPVETTCTDSDGGLNYYVMGSAGKPSTASFDDVCLNTITLSEAVCGSNNIASYQNYDCSGSCVAGVCVNTTTPVQNTTNVTCTDSDGGLNYYVKGYLKDQYSAEFPNELIPDSCETKNVPDNGNTGFVSSCSGSNCYVRDYYCIENTNHNSNSTFCPNGCSDGACVNTSIPVEPTPSCSENYKIRANNFANEGGVDSVSIEVFSAQQDWQEQCMEQSVGDECNIGDVTLVLTNISRTGKIVSFQVNSPAVVDYKYVNTPVRQYTTINSTMVSFSQYDDNYFVVSYCGGVENSCDSLVNQIKNPSDIVIEGINWKLQYNNSWINDGQGETYSYASWDMQLDSQYDHVWANVAELSNKEAVQDRLNNALENGLCQVSRVYTNYVTEEYQNVYTCNNLWRIAYENQQVLTGSAGSYQNDIVVLWFNDNLLFNMEFSANDYYSCSTSEDCDKMDNYQHQRQQSDLIEVVDKLINNKNEYTYAGYLDYRSEQFVNHFLDGCDSKVEDKGYEGSWNCKMEPVICPPHGEQKQLCTRYSQVLGKQESREASLQCSPGICSGCYVPRWFGNVGDNKCIEYGFRFEKQEGWILGDQSFTHGDEETVSVADLNRTNSDASLVVYPNGTALLGLEVRQDDFKYIYLQEGMTYDWDEFIGENHYIEYDATLYVVDVSYDSQNYGESYITIYFNESGVYQTTTPSVLNAYCDIDGQVKQQKVSVSGEWAKCQNNYECFSNACSNGECIDTAALAREITGFKGFIIKMLCRLSNPFSDEGYTQCLAENQ